MSAYVYIFLLLTWPHPQHAHPPGASGQRVEVGQLEDSEEWARQSYSWGGAQLPNTLLPQLLQQVRGGVDVWYCQLSIYGRTASYIFVCSYALALALTGG